MPDGNGQGAAGPAAAPLATMHIVLYRDGNWAYDAPIGNLAVCHTMVGLMAAELACIQFERTRREGGKVVLPGGLPMSGPQRT